MPTPWPRRLFLIAGIYGLLILVPQYFLENHINHDYPPAITHPEFFYGFIGVAVVWQIVYLLIATDPPRFRPLIVLAALAKFSFAAAVAALFAAGRVPTTICIFAAIDFLLGVLFLITFVRLGRMTKP